MKARIAGLLVGMLLVANASGQMILIDFETDDGGGAIANGQQIESPPGTVFGTYFTLTTTGSNEGAAAFDTTVGGPNDFPGAPDLDLIVDQGNVAILQSSSNPDLTGDIFDIPNDSAAGGTMLYDFAPAIALGFHVFVDTIDVVDRDVNGRNIITLTDESGLTRVVTVPHDFTGEVTSGEPGAATIDLSSGATTESPNIPGLFTSVATDPGFDIDNIVSVEVNFIGSGGIDNFKFILRDCIDDAECDDGDLCTQDLCTDNSCTNPPVECTRRGTFCDPATGDCVECIDNDDCNDSDKCTTDVCTAGACSNTPVTCADNGAFCDGPEVCDPATGDCVSGPAECPGQICCEDSDTCVDECCGDDECDDMNLCTTDACVMGVCQNTPVDCPDDGLFCNGPEACDPATGQCASGPAECPGQICCEDSDTCVDECCGDDECDDMNLCTTDACVMGVCQNTPVDCPDDGLFCNGPEACDPATGQCVSGPAECPGQICCEDSDTCVDECCGDDECDDMNLCTTDACVMGVCQNTPVDCPDDGLFCNGPEACDPATGQCVSGPAECPGQICCEDSDTCVDECCGDDECDDMNLCTTDACVMGVCQNTPVDCPDDGLFCNGPEACDPATGQCASGPAECPGQICCEDSDTCVDECCGDDECDDMNLCTTDACVMGVCQNTPVDCPDDGLFCNGPEACDPATGECASGPAECPGQICCEDSDTCVDECCGDDECDDMNLCTTDACVMGVCQNTPVDCPDDGLFCNGPEACDPATGQCASGPAECPGQICCEDSDTCVDECCGDDECDDMSPCTTDTCVAGVCNFEDTTCPDSGDPCTILECDPNGAQGNCDITTPRGENDPCDDGDPCTTGEVCSGGTCGGGTPVTCPDSGDPCTILECDPNGAPGNCDLTSPRGDNDPCDDGDPCTTGEVCSGGACGGGSPVDCSNLDGPCTMGVCNATTGECEAQPANENMPCDDGDACNVGEVCVGGSCSGGNPVDCPDSGDPCTVLSCDAGGAEGNCDAETPRGENDPCDDGDACTTGEVCSGGTCGGGQPTDCSFLDSICQVGVCNPTSGTCQAVPGNIGGSCNDGNECTENDVCTPNGTCAGSPIDGCEDAPPVPTVGRWGMTLLILGLLAGLAIRGNRRTRLDG